MFGMRAAAYSVVYSVRSPAQGCCDCCEIPIALFIAPDTGGARSALTLHPHRRSFPRGDALAVGRNHHIAVGARGPGNVTRALPGGQFNLELAKLPAEQPRKKPRE